jgi:hypothetical protein
MTNIGQTIAEKNLRIAELVYPEHRCTRYGESGAINLYTFFNHTNDKNNYVKTVDHYNNWNDLMPLVVEHGIDLIQYNDKWKALGFVYADDGEFEIDCEVILEDPQHALADCLLQVLEAKNKEGE